MINCVSTLQQTATAITPNHSRTGSSPAVIQQPLLAQQAAGNPATRWNSFVKTLNCFNERFFTEEPTHIRKSPNVIVWEAQMAPSQHPRLLLNCKIYQRQARSEAFRYMDNQRRHHCSRKCHQIIIWIIAIATTRLTIAAKTARSRTRRRKWFISDINRQKLKFKPFYLTTLLWPFISNDSFTFPFHISSNYFMLCFEKKEVKVNRIYKCFLYVDCDD